MRIKSLVSLSSLALLAGAAGCATQPDNDVFDGVPDEVAATYQTELDQLNGRADITLERVKMVSDFRRIVDVEDATISDLARMTAPAAHVDRSGDKPRIDGIPAGWWPVDLSKVKRAGTSEAQVAVADVTANVEGVDVHYVALFVRSPDGRIRIADPVFDPDPPAVATRDPFARTATGTITEVDDGDGCPNKEYVKAENNVLRFDQDSWGLDNRMVMEWRYNFRHHVTLDCRKDGNDCVAFNKTYELDKDVTQSRKCSPWFSSTTTCEGISDWSEGNSTFSSGNWANTYYSTVQVAGDSKYDDIFFGTNSKRLGFHFRGIAQARTITTYNFSGAPVLPAWLLYLATGGQAAYYAFHLIKDVHWAITNTKAEQNPWYEANSSGLFDSEVELTCSQPGAQPPPMQPPGPPPGM